MKKRLKCFYWISFLLVGLLSFNFSIAQHAALSIEPSSGTFIKWCDYLFKINMNTDSSDVATLDTKFFLSWFDIVNIFPWDMDNLSILSWVATVWPKLWYLYEYLNTYQDSTAQPVSWIVEIATLILNVNTWVETNWYLDFYFLSSGRNWDDSNISFAYNLSDYWTYTQYEDILYFIENWDYSFISSSSCEDLPVIISGQYLQNINKDSWYDYKTVLSQISAWYDFWYPSLYPWDWNRNTRVKDIWRTTWTNTSVILVVTWNQAIQIYEDNLQSFPISILDNDIQTTGKTIIITWNFSSDISFFSNTGILNNQYEYWTWVWLDTGIFFLDVFWIDKILPIATWSYYISWENYIVSLSWFYGWVSWTQKDDEFKIVWFSWERTEPTDYLTDNANIFSMNHDILFTWNWSWYIVYIDRAGNTWTWYSTGLVTKIFTIKAQPQGRLVTSSTPNPNFATIWTVRFYDLANNLILETNVTTNNNGTWSLETWVITNWNYNIAFEWLSHLQNIMRNVIIDDSTTLFDFSSWYLTRSDWLIKNDIIKYTFDYTSTVGYPYQSNLWIESIFDYQVWDVLKLTDLNQSWSKQATWVLWTWLSLWAGNTWIVYFETEVLDPDDSNLLSESVYYLYSWNTDITSDWTITTKTWTSIISVEIAWEIVKDWEINWVDSSLLVDYIAINWATNTNTGYWYVLEDLNANWQVDAADITILWFNLYRTNKVLP